MDYADGTYGYQDYTSASAEAYGYANDAYEAGDMDSYNTWSDVGNQNWNTGVDTYVAGADAYGTASPSTSEGYYGGGYDSGSSYDSGSYDAGSYGGGYDAGSYDTSSSYDAGAYSDYSAVA